MMIKKSLLLIGSIPFFCATLFAQASKGDFFFGGNGVINNNSTIALSSGADNRAAKQFNVQISVNIGYFIKNNWAIGPSIGLGYNKETRAFPAIANAKTVTISEPINVLVFVRRYFLKQKNLAFFPEVNAGGVLGSSRTELITPAGTSYTHGNMTGFAGRIGIGLTWFPKAGKPISFEAVLGLISYSTVRTRIFDTNPSYSYRDNTLSFRNASFGAHYYFY